jgi:hypothetical protein
MVTTCKKVGLKSLHGDVLENKMPNCETIIYIISRILNRTT